MHLLRFTVGSHSLTYCCKQEIIANVGRKNARKLAEKMCCVDYPPKHSLCLDSTRWPWPCGRHGQAWMVCPLPSSCSEGWPAPPDRLRMVFVSACVTSFLIRSELPGLRQAVGRAILAAPCAMRTSGVPAGEDCGFY